MQESLYESDPIFDTLHQQISYLEAKLLYKTYKFPILYKVEEIKFKMSLQALNRPTFEKPDYRQDSLWK